MYSKFLIFLHFSNMDQKAHISQQLKKGIYMVSGSQQ